MLKANIINYKMCALAIVSSLFEQSKNATKQGKVIDCSMVEGAAYLSTWLWSSRDVPGVWSGDNKGTNLLDGGKTIRFCTGF